MEWTGQKPTVRCFFTDEGEHLQELILRSLRVFIAGTLRNGAIL